jgi:hypothetical protein
MTFSEFLRSFTIERVGAILSTDDMMPEPSTAAYPLINFMSRDLLFDHYALLDDRFNASEVSAIEVWTFCSFLFYMHACNLDYRITCKLPLIGALTSVSRADIFDRAIGLGVEHIRTLTSWEISALWRGRFIAYMEDSCNSDHIPLEGMFNNIMGSSLNKKTPNLTIDSQSWLSLTFKQVAEPEQMARGFLGLRTFLLSIPSGAAESFERACRHYGWPG